MLARLRIRMTILYGSSLDKKKHPKEKNTRARSQTERAMHPNLPDYRCVRVDSGLPWSLEFFPIETEVGQPTMSQSGLIARPLAVVMNRRLRSIDAGMTLADAAVVMREEKTGALLVTEQGRYVGIVSETDLVRRGIAARVDLSVEVVRRVMSSPIISIEIDRTAHEASDLMAECNIRHLPVTEEERIVGIVSVRDLLRYFKNWGS